MATEYIRVFARVRPSKSGAKESPLTVKANTILTYQPNQLSNQCFAYDGVLSQDSTQVQVFEAVGKRIVESCLDGYNGTIFAYGQTGSGKTHTMLGPGQDCNFMYNDLQKGVVPRAAEHLVNLLDSKQKELGSKFSSHLTVSFVELYNEIIYDLLSGDHKQINIRADDKKVTLIDVTQESVCSSVDIMRTVEIGWARRSKASTAMNIESSRSHAIFIIEVTMEEDQDGVVNRKHCTLNLVDLAGSERQSSSLTSGIRLKEANNINQSLTVLGRVIRTLSKGKGEFIPYRDSKLTHILKDSLGGNSRTSVIVSVHPDPSYYAETLSTLRFAHECKMVKNHAQANREICGESVDSLKKEITRLNKEKDEEVSALKRELENVCNQLRGDKDHYETMMKTLELDMTKLRVQNRCKTIRCSLSQAEAEEKISKMFENEMRTRLENVTGPDAVFLFDLQQQLIEKDVELSALKDRMVELVNGCDVSSRCASPPGAKLENVDLNVSQMTPKQRRERRRTRYTLSTQKEVIQRNKKCQQIVWGDEEIREQANDENEPSSKKMETQIMELEIQLENANNLVDQKDNIIMTLESELSRSQEQTSEFQNLYSELTKVKVELENMLEKNGEKVKNLLQENSDVREALAQSEEEKNAIYTKLQGELDKLNQIVYSQEREAEISRELFEKEIKNLKIKYEKQIKDLDENMEIINNEHDKKIHSLRNEYDEKIASVFEQHELVIREKNEAMNEITASHKSLNEFFLEQKVKLIDCTEEKEQAYAKIDILEIQLKQKETELSTLECTYERQKNQLARQTDDIRMLEQEKQALIEKCDRNFYANQKEMADLRTENKKLFNLAQQIPEGLDINTLKTMKKELEHKNNELSEKYEGLLHEYSTKEEAYSKAFEELEKLKRDNAFLADQHDQDKESLSHFIGHQNQKQKIKTFAKIKQENVDLKKENAELKDKMKRFEISHHASKENLSESHSTRVTRARSKAN